MDDWVNVTFEEEIVEILRLKCIGFQRAGHELVSVVESLVRPQQGPPTIVYQLKSVHRPDSAPLRFRPRIDIPPPPTGTERRY